MMQEPGFLVRARQVGERLEGFCRGLQARYDLVGDVRALGAMVAVELVKVEELAVSFLGGWSAAAE